MNTKSAIKLARKTPVSRNPNRVDRQLQKLAPKEGEIVAHFVPETVNVDETIKDD